MRGSFNLIYLAMCYLSKGCNSYVWPQGRATNSAISADAFNDDGQKRSVASASSSYQLFTCKRVRLVCAAICRFSSSVGYGCWNNKRFLQEIWALTLHHAHKMTSVAHHEMLKEPWAHNVGGMFRQNPPLVFGLLVFVVQQGWKVHVYLENENQDRPEEKSRLRGLDIVASETKRLPITYLFSVVRAETNVTMVTKCE